LRSKPDPAVVAQRLRQLHDETDRRFAATTGVITTQTGVSIGCGSGCFSCCVDGLTVWRPEADRIAAWVRKNGLAIAIHPAGACPFIFDGRCQVYPARPYVCRSQGAVLRFLTEDGWHRDTCPEHLADVDIEALPDSATFEIGPAESDLVTIATIDLEARGEKGLPDRVDLRELAAELAPLTDRYSAASMSGALDRTKAK